MVEVYKAFQRSGIAGTEDWKALISDDIVFSGPMVRLKGKANFIKFYEIRFKALEKRQLDKIAVCDDYVVTTAFITFRSQPTGAPVTSKALEWWTIRDGKITALESFGDTHDLKRFF